MKILLIICMALALLFTGCQEKTLNKENNYKQSPRVEIADNGITWPKGQALPTMAPVSKQIDLVFVDSLGFSNDRLAMLATLQGLVNREKPRILLQGADDINRWISQEEREQYEYNTYKGEEIWDLFKKYEDYYNGFIVYDNVRIGGRDGLDAVVNLANTVAGLKDCLPVNERTLQKFQELGFDLPIVEDFRGKFENKYEVYEFLYNNYWKDCDKRILVSVSPASHPSHIRDMAVATKSAIIWLSPTVAEDVRILTKFLNDLKAGESIILGWWTDEGAGIKIGTNHGISTVPADFFENSTIHAGMNRNLDPPPIPDKPKLENKIYVAATMTDGDNIQFNQHVMRTRWEHRQRGSVVMNWTISPALADIAPDIMNYYYRSATPNDCLVSGPLGIGYASLENIFPQYIDAYAKWTDQYLARTNITFVTVWRHMTNFGVENSYTKNLRSAYGVSVLDWNRYSFYDIVNDKPLFPQMPWYSSDWKDMYNSIFSRSRGFDGTKPIFIASHSVTWNEGVTEMMLLERDLKKTLGEDNVVFIRLDHMSMLINEYENKPYNLCLRPETTITASDNSEEVKKAADGTYDTAWTSSKKGDKWLCFDLGEEYIISRYVLKNAGTDLAAKSLNTRDYEVQVSTDNENWEVVDIVKNNEDDARDIDLNNVRARYVKVVIKNPGSDGTARVNDVEIYGVRPE